MEAPILFLGLVLVTFGLIHLASPYSAFYWAEGWKFKHPPGPSDLNIPLIRAHGAVWFVIGIGLLFTLFVIGSL